MSCTLGGVSLPDDTLWLDEFDWSPVRQNTEPTLTGALVIEEGALLAGRPVTLDAHWLTRAEVLALWALLTPAASYTLVLPDGQALAVAWRHDATPIEAEPIAPSTPRDPTDRYAVRLHLMEI